MMLSGQAPAAGRSSIHAVTKKKLRQGRKMKASCDDVEFFSPRCLFSLVRRAGGTTLVDTDQFTIVLGEIPDLWSSSSSPCHQLTWL